MIDLRVTQLSVADLDGIDKHFPPFVLVSVAEEDGGGLQGPPDCIQPLVGGPVILFDAIHILGDHRGSGGFIIGRRHPVPGPGGELSGAQIPVGALTKVVALPEQVAVVRIGQGADLQQRGCVRSAGAHENIHHEGELVDPGAAAIRFDPVIHDVADFPLQIAWNPHDFGVLPFDQRQGEIAAEAKLGPGFSQSAGSIQISQGFAHGCGQIPPFKIPLPRDLGRRNHQRNPIRRSPAEGDDFSVAHFSGTDLDGIDPHPAALILVPIAKQDGGRQQAAAHRVQPLIGGPVILLDAVHIFGDHGRRGGFIIGGHHPVPGPGGELTGAQITVGALTEIVALPEKIPIIGIVQ